MRRLSILFICLGIFLNLPGQGKSDAMLFGDVKSAATKEMTVTLEPWKAIELFSNWMKML